MAVYMKGSIVDVFARLRSPVQRHSAPALKTCDIIFVSFGSLTQCPPDAAGISGACVERQAWHFFGPGRERTEIGNHFRVEDRAPLTRVE